MKKIICILAGICLLIGTAGCGAQKSTVQPLTAGEKELIIYVATDGDDANDGSFQSPYLTVAAARDAVRKIDKAKYKKITVALKSGEYRVNDFTLSAEDSGTEACEIIYCSCGTENAVLNGGITLKSGDFKAVNDKNMLSRLSKKAQKNVVCTDLKELGLTSDDWGGLYAIGTYSTAGKYDGDYVGDQACELFVNDTRMITARYPNRDEWLYTGTVLKVGQTSEKDHVKTENWDNLTNPESDVYAIDSELADRISGWADLDSVWMFGYFAYDWADASTPIGVFDAENQTLSPKFVSYFEAKEYAPYYFYNVFEELDTENEWYLDRENGILYLYKPENFANAEINLSLTTAPIIAAADVSHVTFKDLTMVGTRGDGICISGNDNTVIGCTVKNIAGYAVKIDGYRNTVSDSEICHTGQGGVELLGGNSNTMEYGENRCENCRIHNWSEIYATYQAAVKLRGMGNVCAHNEMYQAPHVAVLWYGSDQTIEYNEIYKVCLLSDDAGAIYTGKSWVMYGGKIQYNYIHDLGSDGHTPHGIYLDDALSGQTVIGNVLVNIPGNPIFLGGGRDLTVQNNIIIGDCNTPILYDQRAIDGFLGDWFTAAKQGNTLWTDLEKMLTVDAWCEAHPKIKAFNLDYNAVDDPLFPPNPANSTVTDNLIVNDDVDEGTFYDKVLQYSTVRDNPIFTMDFLNDLFVDAEQGNYTLKEDALVFRNDENFEAIPFDEIGIVTKA